MPWETTDARDQKKQLMEQWQSGRYSKAELARRCGVSRTAVYEWIGRPAGSRTRRRQRWSRRSWGCVRSCPTGEPRS